MNRIVKIVIALAVVLGFAWGFAGSASALSYFPQHEVKCLNKKCTVVKTRTCHWVNDTKNWEPGKPSIKRVCTKWSKAKNVKR